MSVIMENGAPHPSDVDALEKRVEKLEKAIDDMFDLHRSLFACVVFLGKEVSKSGNVDGRLERILKTMGVDLE